MQVSVLGVNFSIKKRSRWEVRYSFRKWAAQHLAYRYVRSLMAIRNWAENRMLAVQANEKLLRCMHPDEYRKITEARARKANEFRFPRLMYHADHQSIKVDSHVQAEKLGKEGWSFDSLDWYEAVRRLRLENTSLRSMVEKMGVA